MDWRVLNSSGSIRTQGSLGVTGPTGPTGGSGLSQTLQFLTTGQTVLTSTGYTAIGLSGSITPTSASNRIRIQVGPNIALQYTASGPAPSANVQVLRGATGPTVQTFLSVIGNTNATVISMQPYLDCIDSPATTGATTYVVQAMYSGNATTHAVNYTGFAGGNPSSYLTLSEIV